MTCHFKILILFLITIGPRLYGTEIQKFKMIRSPDVNYYQFITAEIDYESVAFNKYQAVQIIANPQIEYPNMRLTHLALDVNGKREFLKTYTINEFGFRKTIVNPKARQHFIIAGDSHIFGHGCNDDETIASFLAKKFPAFQMINLGISGSAGNSLYYVLNHYNIKEMIPSSLGKGIFIYDFSDYLIERMIGSKNFIRWGWMQPAYAIDSSGKLIFKDSFNALWITKFYKIINLIDPNNYFIKNLPRIRDEHLKLVAKIFLEIKNKYLLATNPKNHFYLQINPFFINDGNQELIQRFEAQLKNMGIEVLSMGQIKLRPEYFYPKDKHLTPEGHNYYADLIVKELRNQP
jgi:hypothetical protein